LLWKQLNPVKTLHYLLEDHFENVRFDVFDPNWRIFSAWTPQQTAEIITGGEQIKL